MGVQFYDFEAKSLQGKQIGMEEYKGKAVLVVNTASKCGLTPQFEGLQALYEKYKEKGFVILGFPCNQFGQQEPGDNDSISKGCVLNYGVSFPMFSKIEVNGENAHPLYKFLKQKLKGFPTSDLKWNFTKFLISPAGEPVKRFAPTKEPQKIEKYLKKFL